MNKPSALEMSAGVPTVSAGVPYRRTQESTGEQITREASSYESLSSLPFNADVSQAFKVYATAGEEAAAYERQIAEAHYDAEFARLQAELRERHRRAFQHERERLFARVERLRGKTLAGLEAA